MRYVCSVCGYVYEADEFGGAAFEEQDDTFFCPICGVKKGEFIAEED